MNDNKTEILIIKLFKFSIKIYQKSLDNADSIMIIY